MRPVNRESPVLLASVPDGPGHRFRYPPNKTGLLICPPRRINRLVFRSCGEGLGEDQGARFDAALSGGSLGVEGGQRRGDGHGHTLADLSQQEWAEILQALG